MKREFQEESFEEFLKRNADNLRMKAPDKIWQNLSAELNKGRRRVSAVLSAFLLATSIFAYLTINNNTSKNSLLPKPLPQTQSNTKVDRAKTPLANNRSEAAEQRISFHQTNGRNNLATAAGLVSNIATAGSFLDNERGNPIVQTEVKETGETAKSNDFTSTIVDDLPSLPENTSTEAKEFLKPAFLSAYDAAPLSIESVINAYKRKKSRFETQFHFTPTISYRKLSENKTYLRTAATISNSPFSYSSLYSSVNNMVTHKPDIGFELGFTEKYELTRKLKVRAGLQFNVNRYDIKAFKAPFALATIALNTRGSSRVDSVWTLSSYSNVNGSSNNTNWLQNLSFQVSAPVGVEVALKGNEKMQFGIATTVQPTYVLGDRAYLITTDYKSYTQVPWLLRRWNVNTAFETFVSYQSGKTKWQIGPQVRYQLLSSFISNYPVKENLFDFGLKIGISVNK